MLPRRKRKTLIITMSVLVVLIIIGIFTYVYCTTDMFKSNKTLFMKYLGMNIENFQQLTNLADYEEYDNQINQNKYVSNIQAKVNYTKDIGTTSENTDNVVNKLQLNIDGQVDEKSNYNYQKFQLLKDEKQEVQLEYLQDGNNYGVRLSDLFKQFVFVKNSNLKELYTKLGIDEVTSQKMPDSFEFNTDLNNMVTFSESELNVLQTKYANIIESNISENQISKKSDNAITINEKTVKTNTFQLTLTKEQLNNIYINMLENIKNEEVILNKLNSVQEMLNEDLNVDDIKLTENFSNYIEDLINDIKSKNIGTEETTITVYENMKNTVRLNVKTPEYEINIDNFYDGEEQYFQISNNLHDESQEDEKITIKKSKSGIVINAAGVVDENSESLQLIYKQSADANTDALRSIEFEFINGDKKVNANIKQTIEFKDEFENKMTIDTLSSNDIIMVNDLEKEQIGQLIQQIQTLMNQKQQQLITDINQTDIDEVLKVLNIVREAPQILKTNITETEKNRFNSQLELYVGEKLKNENVLQMLQASKDYITGIEGTSTELHLKLDVNGNGNEEVFNKLNTFLQEKDNNNREYKIEIKYDETIGIADYIVLTIMQNN